MDIIFFGLQLFAEGSGDGGAATGASAPAAGEQGSTAGKVVYGVQDSVEADPAGAAVTQPQEVSPEARKAQFEALIRGEYKDLYDERMQDTIQKRLKSSKETVDKYNAMAPMLEMLAKKYGVKDAGDVQALTSAIEEDDTFYEEEALKEGIPVDQLKQIRKMERENASLRAAMEQQQQQEQVNATIAQWMEQGQAAKQVYTQFDMDAEMQNPQFLGLLQAGVDVKSAYEVIHKDEIIGSAMQFAAKTAEQKVASSIAAGRGRPSENGNKSQGGVIVKSDVSKLTRADREEIIRQVRNGAKIRF